MSNVIPLNPPNRDIKLSDVLSPAEFSAFCTALVNQLSEFDGGYDNGWVPTLTIDPAAFGGGFGGSVATGRCFKTKDGRAVRISMAVTIEDGDDDE